MDGGHKLVQFGLQTFNFFSVNLGDLFDLLPLLLYLLIQLRNLVLLYIFLGVNFVQFRKRVIQIVIQVALNHIELTLQLILSNFVRFRLPHQSLQVRLQTVIVGVHLLALWIDGVLLRWWHKSLC